MLYLLIANLLLLVFVALLIFLYRPKQVEHIELLPSRLDELARSINSIGQLLKDELRAARSEQQSMAVQNRQELSGTLHDFRKELTETLRLITENTRQGTESIARTLEERMNALTQQVAASNKEARETLSMRMREASGEQRLALENALDRFGKGFAQGVESMNNLQREKFGQLEMKQAELVRTTEQKLEGIRETVDEKLQRTLNERLGQSFEIVTRQLENVQKGLGEMQTLAQDVGGLKKVLSNVKMRGGFGEVQLQMLLENILAPDQFEANVATKKGSADRVEFAVKFPNKEGDRQYVWLPIDAKFPKDAYEYLQNAYDTGEPAAIESAQKGLESVIRKMAKDICDKYLDVPATTNFAILFLPFEGLFAEVVRKASLLEDLQRDCNVIVTGPTTLAVILNSLQMGFRTLAIQQRSSEVWEVLGAVKKEFNLFGGLLEKAQGNIQTGLNQLEGVVGVRTRAIQRKLKSVEVLEAVTPIEITGGELIPEDDS